MRIASQFSPATFAYVALLCGAAAGGCNSDRDDTSGVIIDAGADSETGADTGADIDASPACASAADCATGICSDGVCAEVCTADEDCVAGERCEGGACLRPVLPVDQDGDGVPDSRDNCPEVANSDQADTDNDGVGDACSECVGDDCPCVGDDCERPCARDADCGRGQICEDGLCGPAECNRDADCAAGESCEARRCVLPTVCEDDADCAEGEICSAGACTEADTCGSDLQCDDGEICEGGACRATAACEENADCADTESCVAGTCVPGLCRGDADCADGELCDGGVCVEPPDAPTVAAVRILTRPAPFNSGDRVRIRAVALDADDNVLRGVPLTFAVADTTSFTFAGATLTATDTLGSTTMTAAVDGGPVSEPVDVINLGPADADEDVVVLDRQTGLPIAAALVLTGAEQELSDSDGRASFDARGDGDVTVFATGYDTLTVVAPPEGRLIVALNQAADASMLGGFTGQLDASGISSSGDSTIGLAGAAISGNLVDLQVQDLIGDTFATEISAPIVGTQRFPLPGGLVARVDFLGVGSIKDRYFARTENELTFAWSLGGRVQASSLLPLFTGGGGVDIGRVLGQLLPLFEGFQHTTRSYVTTPRPTIVDAADIDGDGDRTEFIADYNNFPTLSLRPAANLAYRTEVTFPEAPRVGGGPATVYLVVAGVIVEGVGLVPTGISARNLTPGISPAPIVLRSAAPSGGLGEGDFAVAVLAISTGGGGGGGGGFELGNALAARLFVGSRLPERVDIAAAPFPALADAEWDADTRTFDGGVATGDLARVRFAGDNGAWEVWMPAGTTTFVLPEAPGDTADPLTDAETTIDAISLGAGVSYGSLFGGGARSMLDLNSVVTGFVRGEL